MAFTKLQTTTVYARTNKCFVLNFICLFFVVASSQLLCVCVCDGFQYQKISELNRKTCAGHKKELDDNKNENFSTTILWLFPRNQPAHSLCEIVRLLRQYPALRVHVCVGEIPLFVRFLLLMPFLQNLCHLQH